MQSLQIEFLRAQRTWALALQSACRNLRENSYSTHLSIIFQSLQNILPSAVEPNARFVGVVLERVAEDVVDDVAVAVLEAVDGLGGGGFGVGPHLLKISNY